MDYKIKIYTLDLDRKEIAEKLGISYQSLTQRLNGFISWQAGEKEALEQIILSAEKV